MPTAGRASGRSSEQCRNFLLLLLMVSVSTYSAIMQIRLVTSSGLSHPKGGRRQRSFACGPSSSVSGCLPDVLI